MVKMKNILIVDDTKSSSKLIQMFTKHLGHNSKVVENGQLAIIENIEDYDLIFMDIEMPNMNGFETTIHIREVIKSNIPIYALTSHNQDSMPKNIEFNGYIQKPITIDQIKKLIDNE